MLIERKTPKKTPLMTKAVEKKVKIDDFCRKMSINGKCKSPYRQAIGSLFYLANGSRPDIMFAVNYLSCFQEDPSEIHWIQLQCVFQYLLGTSKRGLIFRGKGESVSVFADASFGNDEAGCSTGGTVVKIFGDSIMWRTRKQDFVSLSSTEAEYVALTDVCQDVRSPSQAATSNEFFIPYVNRWKICQITSLSVPP